MNHPISSALLAALVGALAAPVLDNPNLWAYTAGDWTFAQETFATAFWGLLLVQAVVWFGVMRGGR